MEVAVLIGLQASGKSTFYRAELAQTHVHVSKDNFPNARRPQRRQLRLIAEALTAGRDVAVDNTNPSPEEWQPIIDVARECGATVTGYWFPPDLIATFGRNALREGKTRVPDVGIRATLKRLRQPTSRDGFDRLHIVRWDGDGGFTVRPLDQE
ncbi:putative kinase [Herbihabitans rhizosphaerae]|uniref:Putative kinase n=1 Tax=Herbihabitans rhizosphaerae TaxID=1872711 RepID=A0A4Q7L7S6_9PSEU|nr:ATP-binding protein [Herbihabitans rhizosphaerae]RZS44422.1 putative kinase [Herbihabitans rhizosphaerae]